MTQAADDLALIERCQRGERDALDQLVRKYEHRAYQYAMRLTRNTDEAADIVAEAFVRVNGAIKNFKGQSAFSTWLYRIMTNCYLDFRKREKNRSHVSLETSGEGDAGGDYERQIADPNADAVKISETNAREAAMQRALQELPPYQQTMLVMYHLQALSYEEIAESLDLPIGTVKSRLNRARVALRDQLSDSMELFTE